MGRIIGIDLGTTNSCVAVLDGDKPRVIENAEGDRTTPSIIAYTNDGETLVGQSAKRQAVTNPENTLFAIKRLIGRRFQDKEVQRDIDIMPFKIVGADNGDAWVEAKGEKMAPPQISAEVLKKMKKTAEDYLGEEVTGAVITVPAYFNDSQRQATKDAGRIAGLEVKRIINEPTAAALAYGLDKSKDEKIIVFDLGGGTFDVSVLEVADSGDEEQESRVFQVISTSGDTHLGGDDFDEALINHVADEFKKENGIDLRDDPMALQRLQEACEKAKKDLSSLPETDINLPFITVSDNVPKHLTMKITRSKFEELVDDLVERCRQPVLRALKDAGFEPSDIDEIVLVGGSTRVPKVRELVKSIFGKEPHQGVNPDEVVAVGAAIQGSVLAGERTDVLLLDVTPLTLGIETEGGVMTALVERNTTVPAEKKNVFSTAADNQTAVTVRVFQGERKMANSNRLLGEFNLEDIPPQPRGVPQIEVKFDIDQNGIVSVSAKELKTGKEASVTINEAGALSEDDIEQMRKDAESNADEDRKQFELVEARNRANQQVYQLEKQMKEHEDKLTEDDTAPMNTAIEKVKSAAEGDDTAAIKAASDELDAAAQAFSKVLYEKTSATPEGAAPDAAGDAAGDADDDAIDADYEVKE